MDLSEVTKDADFKVIMFKSSFLSKKFTEKDIFSVTFYIKNGYVNLVINVRNGVFKDFKDVRVEMRGIERNVTVTFMFNGKKYEKKFTEDEIHGLISTITTIRI